MKLINTSGHFYSSYFSLHTWLFSEVISPLPKLLQSKIMRNHVLNFLKSERAVMSKLLSPSTLSLSLSFPLSHPFLRKLEKWHLTWMNSKYWTHVSRFHGISRFSSMILVNSSHSERVRMSALLIVTNPSHSISRLLSLKKNQRLNTRKWTDKNIHQVLQSKTPSKTVMNFSPMVILTMDQMIFPEKIATGVDTHRTAVLSTVLPTRKNNDCLNFFLIFS